MINNEMVNPESNIEILFLKRFILSEIPIWHAVNFTFLWGKYFQENSFSEERTNV